MKSERERMRERDLQAGDSVSILNGKCFVVREGDTLAELIAAGMKPEAAEEVLSFRAYLEAKGAGFAGKFSDWKRTPGGEP